MRLHRKKYVPRKDRLVNSMESALNSDNFRPHILPRTETRYVQCRGLNIGTKTLPPPKKKKISEIFPLPRNRQITHLIFAFCNILLFFSIYFSLFSLSNYLWFFLLFLHYFYNFILFPCQMTFADI